MLIKCNQSNSPEQISLRGAEATKQSLFRDRDCFAEPRNDMQRGNFVIQRRDYKTSINIYKKYKKEQPTKSQLQIYKRCAEALTYSIGK